LEAIAEIFSIQHYTAQGVRDGSSVQIGKSLSSDRAAIHHNTVISLFNTDIGIKVDMSEFAMEKVPDTLVASSDKASEPAGATPQPLLDAQTVIEETPTAQRFQPEAMPNVDEWSAVSPSRKASKPISSAAEPSRDSQVLDAAHEENDTSVTQNGPVENANGMDLPFACFGCIRHIY
jgi:hypothetical protein